MEKLKTKETVKVFKPDDGFLPESLGDLEKYLRSLIIQIERINTDIATRINWLLTNTVEAHTADDTLTEYETNSIHTNLAATDTITLTLPTVTKAGVKFTFAVQAAKELRIDPNAATIRDDSGQTAGKYKTANAIGEALQIISDSNGDWIVIGKTGTFTEEA